MVSVPLSKDNLKTWGSVFFVVFVHILGVLGVKLGKYSRVRWGFMAIYATL